MGDDYIKMMKQSLKMSGMSDEQIEAALAMQKAAMDQYSGMAANMGAMASGMAASAASVAADMDMDSYFEFSKKPSINKSYQWAVACGADLIHARADIINDLTTGNDKDIIISVLSDSWGIDTKEDFVEMADSLKQGRHSVKYHQLAEGKDVKDFEEEKENLKEAKKHFKKDGLIGGGAKGIDGAVPNMLIWDLGRLINICRFGFDAGMVSRKAALAYLKDAALMVKKNYTSWKEVSVGYQFGRALWGGLEEYEELKEGMEQLLMEADSPWVTLPFDMKLNFDE
jgi:hypothetical protein